MGRANLILLFMIRLGKWKNGGKAYPKVSEKIKKGMISHSFVKGHFLQKILLFDDPVRRSRLRGNLAGIDSAIQTG